MSVRWVVAAVMTAALAAGACATSSRAPRPASEPGRMGAAFSDAGTEASTAANTAASTTREGFTDAATAPLEDLNLRREEIPPTLLAIEYVYTGVPALHCDSIEREVANLNAVLGDDYDVVREDESSFGERGGEAAGELTLDTVRGAARSIIPFRSIVRRATGAARHSAQLEQAYDAGFARRAFLRGYAAAMGCPAPAAPLTLEPPPSEEEQEEEQAAPPQQQRSWRLRLRPAG